MADYALEARVTELEKVVKELVEGFYQKSDETVVTNTTNFVMYNEKDQKIRGLEAQVEHLRVERDRALRNAKDADEVNARNRVFFERKIAGLESEVDELREARELLEEDLDNARAELGRYEQRLAEAHDYIVNARDVLDMS